jgi:hypothetical protein
VSPGLHTSTVVLNEGGAAGVPSSRSSLKVGGARAIGLARVRGLSEPSKKNGPYAGSSAARPIPQRL